MSESRIRESIVATTLSVAFGLALLCASLVAIADDAKLIDEGRWWAYQPVERPQPPMVADRDRVANSIDAFILHRIEKAGLKPAPPASRRVLIRRAYYDLIGLPPTPEEIEAFVNDQSPDAYEKLIERLLAMPQYGEKWGRHWLDLVRYAESNGYERDGDKPFAWRYRDYVIRAFNEDKPYDRFILEQLAGDELPDRDQDSMIATGFYRLGLWDDEPVDGKQAYYDSLDDVVSTTGQVFLATTINCARCHDHKIDPVPQADYYRLLAFFNNMRDARVRARAFDYLTVENIGADGEYLPDPGRAQDEVKRLEKSALGFERRIEATFSNPEKEDAIDPATRRILLKKKQAEVLSPKEIAEYAKILQSLAAAREQVGRQSNGVAALIVKERGATPRETFVHVRGNANVEGDKVEPGYPSAFGIDDPTFKPAPSNARSSGRRIVLAKWIAGKDNPLTARVMVNRIWQHHFGRGLVETASDFGRAGRRPTHPQLLDWLAAEFVARGWSMKDMHRLMMMSNTYRMSSRSDAAALAKDPQNQLFWRFNMRRLTAEEIRDSALAVTGELNKEMFGPSIHPPLPKAVLATSSRPGAAWGKSPPDEQVRRSVYIRVRRSLRPPILEGFDAAETDSHCAVRFVTTVPTQALTFLNSDFTKLRAERLAERLRKERPDDLAAQVRRGIELTTGRPAREKEIAGDLKLIQSFGNEDGLSDQQAMETYCLMLLNLNEFVYLD